MLSSKPFLLLEACRRPWDVVVVGAGPAGSVSAYGLARHGLDVLLIDRETFPRWKVCGCCLNPHTLGVLSSSGLRERVMQCGPVALRQMHLAAGHRKADVPLPGWRVLSRARLDTALVEAAVDAGAFFLSHTHAAVGPELARGRVVVLRQENRREEIVARLILAANGLGGQLLGGENGRQAPSVPDSRIGAGIIAETGPDFYQEGVIYMAYGAGGYVGLVRQEDGCLNIAAALGMNALRACRNPGIVAKRLLREVAWPAVPGLSESHWRGTSALTRLPSPPCARVLSVGDASGYVEPFTGEGIGWAVSSAAAVIPVAILAVRHWQPSLADEWTAFQRHDARRRRLCRAIAWVSRHPGIARGLVGLVGSFPWLADPLVSHIARG
jgi:flavin-dependent dehydrogenase